jgi:hypothetical protein
MNIEVITILAMLMGGSALIRVLGIRGWVLPALGLIAGISLFIIFGTIQAISPVTTNPVLTITLTAVTPVIAWLIYALRGRNVGIDIRMSVIVIIGVIFAVLVLRDANLLNWHTDSFRYIMTGSIIASDNYDNVSTNLVTKRMLAVPLIHAPANLAGEWYLRSITPLLSVSMLVSMAWLVWMGLRKKINTRTIVTFTVLGLLLLLTTNRFVFHTFYINGHLLFGALLVIIAGASWLLAVSKDAPQKALLTLQAIAIPALVVTRPEASLVSALAILPVLLSSVIPYISKAVLLGVLGVSMVAWQLFVISVYMGEGIDLHFSAYGLLIAGLALILLIPLLRWKRLSKNAKALLWATEGGLWLAALLVGLREPELIVRSFNATFQNVVLNGGSWGVSFIVLAGLFVGLLALTRTPGQVYLRFAVTTFLPLALLLVFLQEGAYRVGDGDSLNRMWMQIIPLAVVYIIVAMVAGEWRFTIQNRQITRKRKRDESRKNT